MRSFLSETKDQRQQRIHNLHQLRTFRRELRKHLTPAEAKLWTHLKGAHLEGRKFRRQHSVARYILDFYCPQERLAIELDGEVHSFVSAQEYDLERDAFLSMLGIKVLRFENKVVFRDTEAVLIEIQRHFGWYLDSGKAGRE
jgi:very-short-patch-repair endonuclease